MNTLIFESGLLVTYFMQQAVQSGLLSVTAHRVASYLPHLAEGPPVCHTSQSGLLSVTPHRVASNLSHLKELLMAHAHYVTKGRANLRKKNYSICLSQHPLPENQKVLFLFDSVAQMLD